MNVLLAILHLVIGALMSGVLCSGLSAVTAAITGLIRGRPLFLLMLFWPALIWYVIVPVVLFVVGSIGDEWGHKTQVFMLVSFFLLSLPGVPMAVAMGVMAGCEEK